MNYTNKSCQANWSLTQLYSKFSWSSHQTLSVLKKNGFLKQKSVSIKINIYSTGLHLSTNIQKWEFILLGCDAVVMWETFLTFQRTVVSSSSRVMQFKTFFLNHLIPENEETMFFEIYETTHPTQYHIPDNLHPQQHYCEKLKFCKL